jgi:hypothetical protein
MGQTSLAMLEKPNIIGAVRELIRLRILSLRCRLLGWHTWDGGDVCAACLKERRRR